MRSYIISAGGITVANQAVSLIFLNPGTSATIAVKRLWVGQSANATSAQQRIQVVTQVTAFPTLTSATPAKTNHGDPISLIVGGTAGAAGTCGINASAEGAGAKTIKLEDAFNVLNGWLWMATKPDFSDAFIVPASSASGIGLHLPVAPATLTNWAFGMEYVELG